MPPGKIVRTALRRFKGHLEDRPEIIKKFEVFVELVYDAPL